MTLNEHIWNHFIASGRIEQFRNEPLSPSSSLLIHLRVIRREFGDDEFLNIINKLSEQRVKHEKDTDLSREIRDLIWKEPSFDEFTKEKISPGSISRVLRDFINLNKIESKKIGQETIVRIQANQYDVDVRFLNPSEVFGLRYSVVVFNKGNVKSLINQKYRFVSDYLWGGGLGQWDYILNEDSLTYSLSSLMMNCHCVCDALDSFNYRERTPEHLS